MGIILPKCKTCGSKFTDKSKEEFQAAPAWKDECPACTKKKFEKYLSEYLLKLVRPEGLITLAKRYFGEAAVGVHEADSDARILAAITDLVYSRRGKQGIKAPATPGEAITAFVTFSDDAIKENARPDSKTKLILALLITGAASIIAIAILFYIFW
jgi:hypothetical protein